MDFGSNLKEWRNLRRMSQLDLALEANVSARHISFLETGRSGPSREMVGHLSEILNVPKGHRNILLTAAGFAAQNPSLQLDDAVMKPVQTAISRMISQHDPYPAIVLDQLWVVQDMNATATLLMGSAGISKGTSLLKLLCDLDLVRALIENWGEVGFHTLSRLRMESAAAGGLRELDSACEIIAGSSDVANFVPVGELPPVIPTIYRANGMRLSLFSTFTQFGTAEEISLAETKIEMMFPADDITRTVLENLQIPA